MPLCYLAAGMGLAIFAGVVAGWARYWYGYFVLGQGVLAGLFIPWAAVIVCSTTLTHRKTIKKPCSITLVLIFFACFMVAQAIGFGMAQPWFDPVGWLGRVIQGGTQESIWGITLLGGAVAKNFQLGVNGGFWIFLNLFDLFFMVFFLLVGINSQPKESR
ncbi:hypothetical protein JWG39_00410 [Desulforhopalus vacuolatus]|uniref:hypothetical protein n=1 Tax=Desulforhopalus vacuolatus TaxID=40414 RepID=UPI001965ADCA|nr:hypothetical protein [Desulforhopalus vacuolatus]MBM9518276.1 hypothetical protein [Desulforhopalus vacuolatus]